MRNLVLLSAIALTACTAVTPPKACMDPGEQGTVMFVRRDVPGRQREYKAEHPTYQTPEDTVTIKFAMDDRKLRALRTCSGDVNGSVETLDVGDHVHVASIRRTEM